MKESKAPSLGRTPAQKFFDKWQGLFYLIALLAGSIIPEALIHEIVSVGGILIVASGLSLLEIKDCKSLNLIPSLLVPVLFFLIIQVF